MKKLLSFSMVLFATIVMMAAPIGPVPLSIDIVHNGSGDHTRAPVALPVLYLDGYTLTASSYTLGSTIELEDESGNVVLSTYVYVQGDIELPEELEGTYTIRVIRGSQTFTGEITL